MRNNLGYFLGITGYSLKGKEVAECGIADFFVKQERLEDLEKEIVEKTTRNIELDGLRTIVKKYAEPIDQGRMKYAHEDLVNNVFGKASLETIYEELDSTNKDKDFAREVLEIMNRNSPLSMKVIFEQIKRGKNLSFEDNLKMDMRLATK